MHSQIAALPEQLARKDVVAAFQGLGIPVERLTSVEVTRGAVGVYLTVWAEDADGKVRTDGSGDAAQHRIWVPIVDGEKS